MSEQHFGITGFLSTHKNHQVLCACKGLQFFYPVSHVTAYRVVVLQQSVHSATDGFRYTPERFHRHRCLREEIDIACGFQFVQVGFTLHHDSRVAGLSLQSDDFRMTGFAEDDYLCFRMQTVGLADAVLQFLHHRTGSIYHFHTVPAGYIIRGRRFAMRTQQHASSTQFAQTFVIDGFQAQSFQTFHFLPVVNDITQTEQLSVLQLFFSFPDGTCHSEAKARLRINGYRHYARSTALSNRRRISSLTCSIFLSELSTTTASSACRRGLSSRWVSR